MTRMSHGWSVLFGLVLGTACGGNEPAPVTPAAAQTAAPAPPAPPAPSDPTPAPAEPEHAGAAGSHEKAHAGAPHWTYAEPAKWGDLSQQWAVCKSGTRQSPIDISTTGAEADKALKPLVFEYARLPLQIQNNGHTLQVTAAPGSKLQIGDDAYELAQFHFHAPSEHSIDGKLADMELHLVHKNASGELAVVGVLLKKGRENKLLAPVFANAPGEVSDAPKSVENATVDLPKLVPAKAAYFTYPGSLTTPPCTEGVRWLVLERPLEVSEAQIARFREITHGDTNRPLQALGDRKPKRRK